METAVTELTFVPLIPWSAWVGLTAVAVAALAFGVWFRLPGALWRGVAAAVLLLALANPRVLVEEREALPDAVFVVVDRSGSQNLGDRPTVTAAAEAQVITELGELNRNGDLDVRVVPVGDGLTGSEGTQLLTALSDAAQEVSPDRIAGAVVISDGRVHDVEQLETFPGPVHALITGEAEEFDRRLQLVQAPAFGMLREGISVSFVVEEFGVAPPELGSGVRVAIAVDGQTINELNAHVGESRTVRVPLTHAGPTVVDVRMAATPGEVTMRNNRAVFTVTGIRDRLRVLLVSGSPHPAGRVWRNLLKADPSVDLVHFTILRSPNKQAVVPVDELSLIEFPSKRLFLEEIDEFDLLIFDRYRRQGVLPDPYLNNIARYVREGGALLLASGGEFATASSIARSGMNDVLPVEATGGTIARAFNPALSRDGERHPLTAAIGRDLDGAGPWYRQVDMRVRSGRTLLVGADGMPLLTVDRVGEGRVGVLASEHAWLWSRGHGGGGPHGELFRRIAHWLMQEPELEEEALSTAEAGGALVVSRRTLADSPGPVEVVTPDGRVEVPAMTEVEPGLWRGTVAAENPGLFRARVSDLESLALVGAGELVEFRNPTSTTELLTPLTMASDGTIQRIDGRVPSARRVRSGRSTAGSNWYGIVRREAYAVLGLEINTPFPAWLALGLAIAALCLAWWSEAGGITQRLVAARRMSATS